MKHLAVANKLSILVSDLSTFQNTHDINFFSECLKRLQKPSCPLCRAEITPIGKLTSDDITIMEKHLQKSLREYNERALCKYEGYFYPLSDYLSVDVLRALDEDRIIVGSPEWIAGSRWIIDNTTPESLVSRDFGDEDVFHFNVHNAITEVNPAFEHTHKNCQLVNDLISDFITINKPRQGTNVWPTEMTEWFCERLVIYSRKSDSLHAAMHLAFPLVSCENLRLCATDSLRILYAKMISELL